jgi:hypothetical protein
LVLSPTVHPWYLCWVLPLVALRPKLSWIVLSLTSGLYFITVGISHDTGVWRLPQAAQIWEWTPFLLLLLFEAGLARRRFRAPVSTGAVSTVSVIIPVRNEADGIAGCVTAVLDDPAVCEVIVVDGGSSDRTVSAATAAGARVVSHDAPPESGGGRGGQINAGLRVATGDVVAVVHADVRVKSPCFSRVVQMLEREPGVVGGALGSVFDGSGFALLFVGFLNDVRSAFLGVAFGDQVQYFRREPVMACDAYPVIPLMEDVELSLRLAGLGRLVYLFGDATVSARAWQWGRAARAMLVVRLVTVYLWRRLCGRADAVRMYREYYGRG